MAERQHRDGEIVELPPEQYKHCLRVLQRLDPSACRSIANEAEAVLAAIGVETDPTKVKTELYEGAVDVDLGSMRTWMHKVNSRTQHKRAVKQLQTIQATAASRVPAK